MTPPLPRLIEPDTLADLLDKDLLIIDLCSDQQYHTAHIPGAIHVLPSELVDGHPPTPGKLPDSDRLEALFCRLGLTPETRVVVYDDEGGGWAGRMAWTLDVIGHDRWSYLNGGLIAWLQEGYPVTSDRPQRAPAKQHWQLHREFIAEADDILARLDDPNFLIWDARSAQEYDGSRAVARRAGHIPGAIHCEWTSLMDPQRHYRIREDAREHLASLGITPDRTIATHCQSHHRSGFTYMTARILGFPAIKGYHGSWSEWGNRDDTPVETGRGD